MNNILEIAILEMARQRGKTPFGLNEVIQWIFPQDWQHFTEEIESAARGLQEKGMIDLNHSQNKEGETELKVVVQGNKTRVNY